MFLIDLFFQDCSLFFTSNFQWLINKSIVYSMFQLLWKKNWLIKISFLKSKQSLRMTWCFMNFQRIIFQHTCLCWKAFNLGFHAWIFVASRIKFQDINFKYWYHINSVYLYTMLYYINLKKKALKSLWNNFFVVSYFFKKAE